MSAERIAELEGAVELLAAEKQVLNNALSEHINKGIQMSTAIVLLQSRSGAKDGEIASLREALAVVNAALTDFKKSAEDEQAINDKLDADLEAATAPDNDAPLEADAA